MLLLFDYMKSWETSYHKFPFVRQKTHIFIPRIAGSESSFASASGVYLELLLNPMVRKFGSLLFKSISYQATLQKKKMDLPNENIVFLFYKQSYCRILLTIKGNKMMMLTMLQLLDKNTAFGSAEPDDFYSKIL